MVIIISTKMSQQIKPHSLKGTFCQLGSEKQQLIKFPFSRPSILQQHEHNLQNSSTKDNLFLNDLPRTKNFRNGRSPVTLFLHCTEANCAWSGKNVFELNGHLTRDHQLLRYRCLVRHCGRSFKTTNQLEDHVVLVHKRGISGQIPFLDCSRCSRHFGKHAMLYKHFTLAHVRGLFQCSYRTCVKVFDVQQQLYRHRKHCPHKKEGERGQIQNEVELTSGIEAKSPVQPQSEPIDLRTVSRR